MLTRVTNGTDGDDPRYRETQTGFWKLRLVIEVRDDGVYVRFDPLHRSFQRIGFEEIVDVEPTTYSAVTYGGWGWGIRLSPTGSNKAYRITGEEGVRLTLASGKQVFVGSTAPGELADAVQSAREETSRD